MITRTLTYSNNTATYKILDDLKVEVNVQQNVYEIPLEDLFLMAARINKKRSFLFVSKVLGKHIPIQPAKGILIGALLAARYLEVRSHRKEDYTSTLISQFREAELNSVTCSSFVDYMNPIVIGFAETATALGHAFFEAFKEADYFHTTRELLDEVEPAITFEEEHSHATSHRAYIDQRMLNNSREIILVDDELTTGKTALNIIRSIHAKFPRTTYTVVSILDWRSDEHIAQFKTLEAELGIEIHSVSLIKGTVSVVGNAILNEEVSQSPLADIVQNVSFHALLNPSPALIKDTFKPTYTRYTGRFGLTADENREACEWLRKIGKELAGIRSGQKTLVLGTGEYMYLPMKIASYMGDGVFYQSTTRSPIYPINKKNYGATNRFSFSDPVNHLIQNFVYNISPNTYDDLFLFFERKVELEELHELLEELKRTRIRNIRVVYLTEEV